jgi:hypothetical protein
MNFFLKKSQQDIFQDKLQGRFHNRFQDRFEDKQTPPSNSLKLIEFETMYIKTTSSPPFPPTKYAMVATRSILTSNYALRARDYIKRLSQHP